jgi:hypothetical protein
VHVHTPTCPRHAIRLSRCFSNRRLIASSPRAWVDVSKVEREHPELLPRLGREVDRKHALGGDVRHELIAFMKALPPIEAERKRDTTGKIAGIGGRELFVVGHGLRIERNRNDCKPACARKGKARVRHITRT